MPIKTPLSQRKEESQRSALNLDAAPILILLELSARGSLATQLAARGAETGLSTPYPYPEKKQSNHPSRHFLFQLSLLFQLHIQYILFFVPKGLSVKSSGRNGNTTQWLPPFHIIAPHAQPATRPPSSHALSQLSPLASARRSRDYGTRTRIHTAVSRQAGAGYRDRCGIGRDGIRDDCSIYRMHS